MKDGFVALISVLLIATILLLIVSTLNFTGYVARVSVLDSELKEMSQSLAEGCLNIGIIKLAGNSNLTLTTPETHSINNYPCQIISIQANGYYKTIVTQAIVNDIYTNLKTDIDPTSLKVVSQIELATTP